MQVILLFEYFQHGDLLCRLDVRLLVGKKVEMYYLNTIEQLFLFVEQLDQFEVCLPYGRLLIGIPMQAVFQNLRWNSNKTSLSSKSHLSKLFILFDE